ncbi:MAG TPA: tRNA uracil 4-sulfurtransferase ThiI [Candidatus Baltobacteraceae bacterium]|nr:tRNA uracil 4-sulfurtransferase ThiI [Candidatus Baltobacteraceae bacterium]
MEYSMIVIHFGEIWLKGKNRNDFIGRLYGNIRLALAGEKYARLVNVRDRFIVELEKGSDIDSISERLGKVFGISWFAPVAKTENSLSAIMKTANKLLAKRQTVRIVAHRAFKGTKFNSREIVSAFIKGSKKLNFKIDKDAADSLFINVTSECTLMYTKKVIGQKGLPVGCSGKAVVLLSGGIDSPVASYYAMKRGLELVYLHLHAFPNNKEAKESKMRELVEVLGQYSPKPKIYYAPSYMFQSAAMKIPGRHELILFKRFAYKLAEKVAEMEGANSIVTGESLGQVASQTVTNLAASEHDTDLFIFRPLIGFDKQEIINEAKEMGTYEISIRKYKDVCSINARNPSTSTDYKKLDLLYKKAALSTVLKRTMAKTESVVVSTP